MMTFTERDRALDSLNRLDNAITLRNCSPKDYLALTRKISKAKASIEARPYWLGPDYLVKGILPNGERTSFDEAESLQMLADYFKAHVA